MNFLSELVSSFIRKEYKVKKNARNPGGSPYGFYRKSQLLHIHMKFKGQLLGRQKFIKNYEESVKHQVGGLEELNPFNIIDAKKMIDKRIFSKLYKSESGSTKDFERSKRKDISNFERRKRKDMFLKQLMHHYSFVKMNNLQHLIRK